MNDDFALLFIEPERPASPSPMIDHITRRMCAAFRKAEESDYAYAGTHICICGAESSDVDYHMPNGMMTNALCVHYVAHHRDEVPQRHLSIIEELACGEVLPNSQELQGPEEVLKRKRDVVERGVKRIVDGFEALGPDRHLRWTAWGLDIESLARARCFGRDKEDADDLLNLVTHIRSDVMALFEQGAREEHGEMQSWGRKALRATGWSREAWLRPLITIIDRWDGEPDCLRDVLSGLPYLGRAAGGMVPSLIASRSSDARNFQSDLDHTLIRIFRMGNFKVPDSVAPELIAIAENPQNSPDFRIEVARLLGRTELAVETAVSVLIEMATQDVLYLEPADSILRGTALGMIDDPEPGIRQYSRIGIPLLLEAIEDPDGLVRRRAAELLIRLGTEAKAAIPALEKLADRNVDCHEVKSALSSLKKVVSVERPQSG